MTHLKSFIKKESGEKEYKLDDIDHPNGWDWKELDMYMEWDLNQKVMHDLY